MRALAILAIAALVALGSCAPEPSGAKAEHDRLNLYARRYVDLYILLGHHDEWTAGGFYGPASWRKALADNKASIPGVIAQLTALEREIRAAPPFNTEPSRKRAAFLADEVGALIAYAEILGGAKLPAAVEAKRLYLTEFPPLPQAEIDAARAALDRALPGEGSLEERYNAYRRRILVPQDRMAAVMQASSDECRRRISQRITLPLDHGLRVLVPTEKQRNPGGDLEFVGGFKGTIVAPRGERTLDYAFTTACHEGYLGHYLKALFREHRAQNEDLPELYIWAISGGGHDEGTAELGPELAFTPDEAAAFSRDVLAPLAGLDPAAAELNGRIGAIDWRLKRMLWFEGSRRVLYGEATLPEAAAYMQKEGLISEKSAHSLLTWATTEAQTYALLYQSAYVRFERDVSADANADKLGRWLAIVKDPWRR